MQESPITFNPYQPPNTLLKKKEGSQQSLWSDVSGKYLYVEHDAVFPDRCIKCDQPVRYRLVECKLYWTNPFWIYLLIVIIFVAPPIGLFLFIFIGLMAQKKATITVGLCEKHRIRKRNAIIFGWSIFLLSMILVYFFYQIIFYSTAISIYFMLCVTLTTVISLSISRTVTPKRITEDYILIKGVSKEFISHFPIYNKID